VLRGKERKGGKGRERVRKKAFQLAQVPKRHLLTKKMLFLLMEHIFSVWQIAFLRSYASML